MRLLERKSVAILDLLAEREREREREGKEKEERGGEGELTFEMYGSSHLAAYPSFTSCSLMLIGGSMFLS